MNVENFVCITHNLCFTRALSLCSWGPMQRFHRRGSQVMSECCKVGYSATLATAYVHNFICSENRGLLSLGDLCRDVI